MIAPMPAHPATLPPEVLLTQCDVARGRASGPGGQHRNKVETAVVITHRPSGVSGQASERREQARNRAVALFRLRVNLALQVRETPHLPGVPSALWRSRARAGRIALNPEHADFPAMLAEALDVLGACDGDLPRTARLLDVTPSQLVKLFKDEPRALAQVNAARVARGEHALR